MHHDGKLDCEIAKHKKGSPEIKWQWLFSDNEDCMTTEQHQLFKLANRAIVWVASLSEMLSLSVIGPADDYEDDDDDAYNNDIDGYDGVDSCDDRP